MEREQTVDKSDSVDRPGRETGGLVALRQYSGTGWQDGAQRRLYPMTWENYARS